MGKQSGKRTPKTAQFFLSGGTFGARMEANGTSSALSLRSPAKTNDMTDTILIWYSTLGITNCFAVLQNLFKVNASQ